MAGTLCAYKDQYGNTDYKTCYAGCCETECCSFDTPDHQGLPGIALYGIGIGGGLIVLALIGVCCGVARKRGNHTTQNGITRPFGIEDTYSQVARRYDNPALNPFHAGYNQPRTQRAAQTPAERNGQGTMHEEPLSVTGISQPMSLLEKKTSGAGGMERPDHGSPSAHCPYPNATNGASGDGLDVLRPTEVTGHTGDSFRNESNQNPEAAMEDENDQRRRWFV